MSVPVIWNQDKILDFQENGMKFGGDVWYWKWALSVQMPFDFRYFIGFGPNFQPNRL